MAQLNNMVRYLFLLSFFFKIYLSKFTYNKPNGISVNCINIHYVVNDDIEIMTSQSHELDIKLDEKRRNRRICVLAYTFSREKTDKMDNKVYGVVCIGQMKAYLCTICLKNHGRKVSLQK